MNGNELVNIFFRDLKQYNSTNFKTLETAQLLYSPYTTSSVIHKAFSSAITRYFIFCEKHPEISATDKRILYYKLKLDLVARYFATYPDSELDQLKAFQLELKNYVDCIGGKANDELSAIAVSD